jgi:hypothetical protein
MMKYKSEERNIGGGGRGAGDYGRNRNGAKNVRAAEGIERTNRSGRHAAKLWPGSANPLQRKPSSTLNRGLCHGCSGCAACAVLPQPHERKLREIGTADRCIWPGDWFASPGKSRLRDTNYLIVGRGKALRGCLQHHHAKEGLPEGLGLSWESLNSGG